MSFNFVLQSAKSSRAFLAYQTRVKYDIIILCIMFNRLIEGSEC